MSEIVLNEVRKGFYLDSVALMRLSREIGAMDGVVDAALMMASPSNLAILRDAGLIEGEPPARSNDLMLALRARDRDAGEAALAAARAGLDRPKSSAGTGSAWRPRSIAAAVRETPEANLTLISVPGNFAAAEARKALRRGLNVLMFSDNVPLEDELSLKREAHELGLLMMGPDCGTAILGGVPLAFANRVSRGSIGIIGASGTGIQEVSSLLSEAGAGISHAIGVGGRDLKQEIGAITTLMAIDALDADASTEAVVVISKPPSPEIAARVLERVGLSAKPYTICFIGAEQLKLPSNARQAATLLEAAELALGRRIGAETTAPIKTRTGRVEGLYSGGTLAAEAQVILKAAGRHVASNAPVPGVASLGTSGCDQVIDLGADEYTQGRPHPMIDPSVRDDALRRALSDSGIAVILIDLVIGYGAHANPAAHLVAALGERQNDAPIVIGSVTGTRFDPQDRLRQVAQLKEAGVIVTASNAHACRLALVAMGISLEISHAEA